MKVFNKCCLSKTCPKKVLKLIENHFKRIFESKSTRTEEDCSRFLKDLNVPQIKEEDKLECEKTLAIQECYKVLNQMGNDKTPGNDGLTKEFYLAFWMDIGQDLVKCLNANLMQGSLTTTQSQIIVTLIEKTGKDSRMLDSWRPISLINVDIKIGSKVLSNRLKNVLSYLIHEDQAAFIKGRNIDDPLQLIRDMIDYIKDYYKDNNLLIFAADFEKTFGQLISSRLVGALLRRPDLSLHLYTCD